MESDLNLIILRNETILVQALKEFNTIEKINALEEELLQIGSVFIPVKHVFFKGGYARQVTMPSGIIAIGHAHSDECLNIVSKGSVSVLINGEMRKISAPATFVSPPYDRKVGYVHEELIWTTVHATDLTQIEDAESKLIIKTNAFKEHESKFGNPTTSIITISGDDFTKDRIDYYSAIRELGFTHEQVKAISQNTSDQIPFPKNYDVIVEVRSSKISGNGLFSSTDLAFDEVICPALIAGKRTPAGRFTNHSANPNCEFIVDSNGDMHLKCITFIPRGIELTVNYRDARLKSLIAKEIINLNTIK